ncbi:MAG: SsrA-binding protein SmpB [Calditrichaeota bacterium]|nr:MAG: SsrA-binding protein SmpB [Calditrichota bacterium]
MEEKVIATNRKARHDYQVLDTLEAGIVLTGTEVKSLREGKANLKDSYATVKDGEVFLFNVHISPYTNGGYSNHEPRRERKLLLHKKEIKRLIGRVQEKGLTLVPLKLYFKRGKAKVELAVARGKKSYDKRHDMAKREAQREIDRHMKAKKRF